jgi:hypothetical protein
MRSQYIDLRRFISKALLLSALAMTGISESQADDAASPQTEPSAPAFKQAVRVADDVLSSIAGKADVSQSVVANNTSNVSNNSVNGQSTTGTLTFADGAFRDLRGLAVISANTGNNVAINSSLNVTVSLQH